MKERLVQLLDLEQISPSKFADIIGVQRSSVSHVVSGRNKPSFDFIQKTLKAFPGLNAEWLILGEGTMYERMGRVGPGTLFDTVPDTPEHTKTGEQAQEEPLKGQSSGKNDSGNIQSTPRQMAEKDQDPTAEIEDLSAIREKPGAPLFKSAPARERDTELERKVVQVIVFYDDDTFRSYASSK